jgi:BirA family transcriptional regulator, biotin operon repressor / biotin---[acetyl-CoA-carboxylase] ligase
LQEDITSSYQFQAIIELFSVDSTNNYALQKIREGLAYNGMAVFAHEQTAGKGQRGKTWSSRAGENLIMSVVIEPRSFLVNEQFILNATIALGVRGFLEGLSNSKICIKWPNDIYFQDRKAGGILIENILQGQNNWKWAVAGIGMNINQTVFDPLIPNPVSLKLITDKPYDCLELAHELRSRILKSIDNVRQLGAKVIINEYNSHLYKRNQVVKLKQGNRIFKATIKSVTKEGKLVVAHAMEEQFDFGEINWVLD